MFSNRGVGYGSSSGNTIGNELSISSVNVLTGTIASGEQVNTSKISELSSFLSSHCDHASAIEMEGLGFLEACRPYPHIQSLLMRGISDLIDGNPRQIKVVPKKKLFKMQVLCFNYSSSIGRITL